MARRAVKILAVPIIMILVAATLYTAGEIYRHRDHGDQLLEEKGQLVLAEETLIESGPDHTLFHLLLENDRGIRTQGHLRLPSAGNGPYPVLVILGGLRTGKKTLGYIGDTEGLALLALDYPYEGKKHRLSWWEFVTGIPAMRRAILNTVPATMLSIDYLMDRGDIDSKRIVLIGGSFGAFFSPAIAALDRRIAAVGLIFGGGDLRAIAKANLNLPGPIAHLAAWLLAVLVAPIEPLKYINDISPRPLFMMNGTNDPVVPERCCRLLYAQARDPKSLSWIPAGHVSVRKQEFHGMVGRELARWLAENNLAPPGAIFAHPSDPAK